MSVTGLDSYTALLVTLGQWLGRDDDETTAMLPVFVGLAETRIQRNQQWFTETYGVATGVAFAVTTNPMILPVYVKTLLSLWGRNALTRSPIEIVTPEYLADLQNSNNDASGIPKFATVTVNYSDQATNGPRLTLWPSAGASFDVDMRYIRRLDALSTLAPANVLLAIHPDLYLYGALCESAPYLQHDDRLAVWEKRYEQIVAEINLDRERQELPGMSRSRLPVSF